MATVLRTAPHQNAVHNYLKAARKLHTQADLARLLEVDARTIRRWEARQSAPPGYIVPALKQLAMPLHMSQSVTGEFTFIDLFAGIGGIRAAFEQIGGQCVYTSEWDSYAQKTYAANFPLTHEIAGDITTVAEAEIPDHDVLLAGFPCQPFSIAGVSKKNALGRQHGFLDETQGTLFFDVARIIKAKQPRAFLLENVKNLQSHDKGRTFEVIKGTLTKELGYHIHWKVIDAAHFLPQHRERILIAGFREPVGFDWAALKLPEKNRVRLGAILHKTDGTEPSLPWDEARFFDHTSNRVNPKYTLTDHLWNYLQAYAEKHRLKGNGFGFGLVTDKDVTRTLSARYYKDGSEILVKQARKNPRRLTPRECARLMGLPDTFKIPVSDTRAYKQFAEVSALPVVAHVAMAIKPFVTMPVASVASVTIAPEIRLRAEGITMAAKTNLWKRDELLVAFNLYCQIPFGKMHKTNPDIIRLAKLIGRTPSSVAMKLVNFASLDPAITNTGRSGLGNASAADRAMWDEFHLDWERLAIESKNVVDALAKESFLLTDEAPLEPALLPSYEGATKTVLIEARKKQSFFRNSVLSSYQSRCCISALQEPRLLIASHIVPWSKDKSNRLNPRNGLCLSALHDRAFDQGLITVTPDYRVRVSKKLMNLRNTFNELSLAAFDGKPILLPQKFMPDPDFLQFHMESIFIQ